MDPATLDVKPETGGSWLIFSGPSLRRATKAEFDGCCDGLPVQQFHVWLLSPGGTLQQMFEDQTLMSGMYMGAVDKKIQISPDGNKFTIYDAMVSPADHHESWSSVTYCRQAMTYKECAHNDDARPPRK